MFVEVDHNNQKKTKFVPSPCGVSEKAWLEINIIFLNDFFQKPKSNRSFALL